MCRVILPIHQFLLPKELVTEAVPTPTWKQFVVSKLKTVSPQEEQRQRILFWYKQALVGSLEKRGRIVGRWLSVRDRFAL